MSPEAGKRPQETKKTSNNPPLAAENRFKIKKSSAVESSLKNHAPAQRFLKAIESWASYEYCPGQKKSYYTFLEWNRNFHISIAAASRNHAFLDVVRNEQTRLMRYYYYQVIVMDSYGQELLEEHQALVRAIKGRNPELARARATDN